MSQHSIYELKQKQSLPLDAKIQMTRLRLKQWHIKYEGGVYLAFSGGKDSTVLKHILSNLFPDVPAVFCNTGLEYPEVKNFALSQNNVTIITPKMMFKDVINTYGYPVISKEQSSYIYEIRNTKSDKLRDLRLNGRNGGYKLSNKWQFMLDAPFKISNKCCDIMKKAPFKLYEKETGRKGIIATMTDESMLRLNSWLKYGCNAFEATRPMSRPMSFWTEQDILHYIVKYNLKIASVYGDIVQDENDKYHTTGCDRTGCMFCLYGIQKDSTPNRFQRMQMTHPRQYQFCLNELGIKNVLEYMNIPYKQI